MATKKQVTMHGNNASRKITVNATTDRDAIIKANASAGWSDHKNKAGWPWTSYSVKPKKRFGIF